MKEKNKNDIIKSFKEAIEHKKEWQLQFAEKYASQGMKVEFF